MSRLGINTGSNPNDGQGDPLRVAMGKINSNFLEIYNTFGNGFTITSYASTAGISTIAQNLTGSPRINVSGILNTGITTTEQVQSVNIRATGVITATQFIGDGSQLTNVTSTSSGVSIYDDNVFLGVARELNFDANIVSTSPDGTQRVRISASGYATTAGIATYASTAGVATVAQGLTGTPNINVGVVTATSYRGSGVNLTGVITSLVAGTNVTITQSSGIATISAATTSGGSGNYAIIAGYSTSSGIATFATIAGYSTSSGISTVAQGLTGTPNISVNQVGIASYLTVTGVSTFFNNVHFDYDKYVLIGANDELQLFHNGSNSYIENTSTNNLIVRTTGGSIVFQKVGPENMGVFNTDGSVELYYNNVKKFETLSTGATTYGIHYASSFVGDGSGLTNIISTGSGIEIRDNGSIIGTASTINFGDNLNVSAISAGVVTVTGAAGGGTNYWTQTNTGIITTGGVGIGTTRPLTVNTTGLGTNPYTYSLYVNGEQLGLGRSEPALYVNGSSWVNGLGLRWTQDRGYLFSFPDVFVVQVSGDDGINIYSYIDPDELNQEPFRVWSNSNFRSTLQIGTSFYSSTPGISDFKRGVFIDGGNGGTIAVGAAITMHGILGIITASKFVAGSTGSGTSLTSSQLTVVGDGKFTGVVTATRFESTSAGTPTIDSPNNLNINAVTVAISTDVTVGRDIYAGINTSTGLILRSPNGSKYRLIVDDSGNLSTILVP